MIKMDKRYDEDYVRIELINLIKDYEVTSYVHPTQIEGTLSDGGNFYIRYRNCNYYAEVNGEQISRLRMVVHSYEDEDCLSINKMLNLFYLAYENRGEEE